MSAKQPLRENLRRVLGFQLDIEQIYRDQPWTHRTVQGLWMAMQALLAASAAYGLGLLLHTQQAFWAALTSIAVTQQTYLDTRTSARDQIIGAGVGGAVGLAAALLGGEHYLVYAIAIVVGITACWICRLGSAARLSGSTTTIVMLVPHVGSFWLIALTRIGEVALGIACALVVVGVAERIKLRWVSGEQSDD